MGFSLKKAWKCRTAGQSGTERNGFLQGNNKKKSGYHQRDMLNIYSAVLQIKK